jgi:hypothetical protein
MALIGAMGWINAALLIISQILGAIAAAGVVSALFPGPLSVRTTLSPETSAVRGLFIEMFLTAQLIFCIFMLAAEKHRSTFIAPIGIGLALFIAELAGRRRLIDEYYTSWLPQVSISPEDLWILLGLLVLMWCWLTSMSTTGSTGSDLFSVQSSPPSSTAWSRGSSTSLPSPMLTATVTMTYTTTTAARMIVTMMEYRVGLMFSCVWATILTPEQLAAMVPSTGHPKLRILPPAFATPQLQFL